MLHHLILRLRYKRVRAARHARLLALRKDLQSSRLELAALRDQAVRSNCALIGAIIVCWAQIERHLDLLVDISRFAPAGDTMQMELPVMLARKLAYIRKASTKCEWLMPYKSRLVKVIDQLNSASAFRHSLVHGDYRINHTESDLSIRMNKVTGQHRDSVETIYTPEQLLKESRRLALLLKSTRAVSTDVANSFVNQVGGRG